MEPPKTNLTRINDFKKISCGSEVELSEGSKTILNSKQSEIILARFKKDLVAFNLYGQYEPSDIFNEAYNRAEKYLRKGSKIDNLHGWFKGVGYNVIREFYRSEERQKQISKKLHQFCDESFCGNQNLSKSRMIEKIDLYLKNKMNSKLIYLKVIDNLSWQEICHLLIADGDVKCEPSLQFINSIRQRYSRAMRKLSSSQIDGLCLTVDD